LVEERFEGACSDDVLQLNPNWIPQAGLGEKDASADTFAGLDTIYWYVIVGGTIFLAIAIAMFTSCRKSKMDNHSFDQSFTSRNGQYSPTTLDRTQTGVLNVSQQLDDKSTAGSLASSARLTVPQMQSFTGPTSPGGGSDSAMSQATLAPPAASGAQCAGHLRLAHVSQINPVTNTAAMQFVGESLDAREFSGMSDAYLVVKSNGNEVYKSEMVKRDLNPSWKPFQVSAKVLAAGPLHLEVLDWDRVSKTDLIGSTLIDQNSVLRIGDRWPLARKKHDLLPTQLSNPPNNGPMTLWDILDGRESMGVNTTSEVPKPTIAQTFDGQGLSISCTHPGAVIYYTVDGNNPEPPVGQNRKDQESNPIKRASTNGSTPNSVGSSTFRFDRFGSNNNLRIPILLMGEAKNLHVRCVATLEGLENSEVVFHVEKPRIDDPNESFSPAFESFSEPISPEQHGRSGLALASTPIPSASMLSPGGTVLDTFPSPTNISSSEQDTFIEPASEDEAETAKAMPSMINLKGPVSSTPRTPATNTSVDTESSDL
jgi:hypothetical protein